MNTVALVGNLCRDNSVTYSSGDNARMFLRNTIAVQRKYKNKEGKYESDFIPIVMSGSTAEFVNKFFTKGMKIGITGEIRTGSYTNKDGVKVYTTDVVVDSAEFVTSKGENQNQGGTPTPSNDFVNQGIDVDGLTNDLPF